MLDPVSGQASTQIERPRKKVTDRYHTIIFQMDALV